MKRNFKEHLRRKREAAETAPPAAKDPSEMTDQELDAEIARLQREVRAADERAVLAARQGRVGDAGPADNIARRGRRRFVPRNAPRHWR